VPSNIPVTALSAYRCPIHLLLEFFPRWPPPFEAGERTIMGTHAGVRRDVRLVGSFETRGRGRPERYFPTRTRTIQIARRLLAFLTSSYGVRRKIEVRWDRERRRESNSFGDLVRIKGEAADLI